MKSVDIGTNLEYAAIHEFGGTVEAKNGRYLVFENEQGETVFVESVEIPARPYLRPSIDEHGNQALTVAGQVMGTLLEKAWAS